MVITANVGHRDNKEENIQPMNAMIKNNQTIRENEIFTGRIKFFVELLISRQDYVGELIGYLVLVGYLCFIL